VSAQLGPHQLLDADGLLVARAPDMPSLIERAERATKRTWLGLMAAGWSYVAPAVEDAA
jgi:hypothetical protein